ncbi:MAG: rhodanese-like domain-containing protein [Chloroflexota bacterium]|nr:rhodanese-like domain-containing protein [Chloroflexota bacterium]
MYGPNEDPFAGVPQVDPKATQEHFERGEVDLLDVREPGEWNLGHIEGAKWIPMGHLQARWREIDPARKLVVVCRSGSRSNYVAAMLRQVGIDAANLEGGMLAWQAEKLPITAPGLVDGH